MPCPPGCPERRSNTRAPFRKGDRRSLLAGQMSANPSAISGPAQLGLGSGGTV